MSGQDNYKYVYNQTQYNEHDEIYIDTSQERMDFSLTKGIKIWMAFNRELYFCIKLFGFYIYVIEIMTILFLLRKAQSLIVYQEQKSEFCDKQIMNQNIKQIGLIIVSAYLTVTLTMYGDLSYQQQSTSQNPNTPSQPQNYYTHLLLLLAIIHTLDIFSILLDYLGFIQKNFVFFGFKCALDIPSVVMSIVVQIIFFRGVIRGDTNPATCSTQDQNYIIKAKIFSAFFIYNQGQYYCMDQSLKSWLITEIVTMYLMGGAWLALNIYIYCVVHSPRFQYTYYLSLRGQDIDEDEEFKNKYYN